MYSLESSAVSHGRGTCTSPSGSSLESLSGESQSKTRQQALLDKVLEHAAQRGLLVPYRVERLLDDAALLLLTPRAHDHVRVRLAVQVGRLEPGPRLEQHAELPLPSGRSRDASVSNSAGPPAAPMPPPYTLPPYAARCGEPTPVGASSERSIGGRSQRSVSRSDGPPKPSAARASRAAPPTRAAVRIWVWVRVWVRVSPLASGAVRIYQGGRLRSASGKARRRFGRGLGKVWARAGQRFGERSGSVPQQGGVLSLYEPRSCRCRSRSIRFRSSVGAAI